MPLLAPHASSGSAAVLAGMPPALAALIWLWAAVAIIIWIVRLVRRVGRRGSPAASGDATTPPAAPGSVPVAGWSSPSGPAPTLDLADAGDATGATMGGSPVPGSAPPAADPSLIPPAPLDPAMPFAGVAGVAGAAGPAEGERSGFFASEAGAGVPGISDGGRLPGAARPTVVEALRGIAMPCNLTPVVDGSVSIPNPFRVAFLTAEAPAPTVGAALGDELQRLGFTLTTPAATELLARKPGVELRVMLYPTASAARRGLDLIFPAAPEGAVGVEFTT